MDTPFEKEEREADLDRIENLGDYAVKAQDYYRGQITDADIDKLSEEEAIDIAGNFVFSRMTLMVHFSDTDAIPLDEEHAKEILAEYPALESAQDRGEAELALKQSMAGHYDRLKSWLLREAAGMEQLEADDAPRKRNFDFAQKLKELEKVVPVSSGHRFKPPMPPHLDPRFNPDALPLPPSDK